MNELPAGYMTGYVTIDVAMYASTVEGVKKRVDTHELA